MHIPDADLLHVFLDRLPVGTVLMDCESRVIHYNRYEEELAGRKREQVLGRRFFAEVAPCIEVSGLADYFAGNVRDGQLDRELNFRFPKPCIDHPRDVRLTLSSLNYTDRTYGVLFVEDISAIRAIERTKDFLVRATAHDMNNPITALMGTLESMAVAPSSAHDRQIRQALDSVGRLQSMVRNLFDVTRLQSGESRIKVRQADLRESVEAAVDSCSSLADRCGVLLEERLPDRSCEAEVDGPLVIRALVNVIENAIQHSPKGQKVTVRLEVDADHARIAVQDRGPGVSDELRERIFEPYVHGRDGDPDSHGLGLAVVDLVIRQHGGNVELDCPRAGGAVFTLEIPRRQSLVTGCL